MLPSFFSFCKIAPKWSFCQLWSVIKSWDFFHLPQNLVNGFKSEQRSDTNRLWRVVHQSQVSRSPQTWSHMLICKIPQNLKKEGWRSFWWSARDILKTKYWVTSSLDRFIGHQTTKLPRRILVEQIVGLFCHAVDQCYPAFSDFAKYLQKRVLRKFWRSAVPIFKTTYWSTTALDSFIGRQTIKFPKRMSVEKIVALFCRTVAPCYPAFSAFVRLLQNGVLAKFDQS